MTNSTPDIARIAAGLSERLRGWRILSKRKSGGETMCAGCWDRSEHDTSADHDIPSGDPVFYSPPHPEYGDCDAYCVRCTLEDAESYEILTAAEASSFHAYLQEQNP